MKKHISRKYALTIACIVLVTVLSVVGAFTGYDMTATNAIIAVACGVYNLSNVGQKVLGGRNEKDPGND